MKRFIYISLLSVGLAVVVLSVGYRYIRSMFARKVSITASQSPAGHAFSYESKSEAETGNHGTVTTRRSPEPAISSYSQALSPLKTIKDYLKELLGSVASILGFVMWFIERRKKKGATANV